MPWAKLEHYAYRQRMSINSQNGPPRYPPVATVILFLALGLFVGGGLFSGWIFLSTVRSLMTGPAVTNGGSVVVIEEVPSTVNIPGLPPIVIPKPGNRTPTQVPVTPTLDIPLPIWDGKDRVTVLLLGIDQRDDERGLPTRSDTMIIASLDPVNLTGSMLSLPRDLWVPIPGHGENKLNTAHFFGELDKEGSGLQAARRTVQYNFGVPINYVARVDFAGFERLIDAVGGITIDVDRAILDNDYPNEKYGISRLYIPVGPQRMNGITALRYARSRHADSDFGRIRRQQRVLQAAREEALSIGILPRLPTMFNIVRNSVTTDVPWTDLLALADLVRRVPRESITSRQVDETMINDVNRDGSVLIPERDKIRPVVQELFYNPAKRPDPTRIEILNATTREGLAGGLRNILAEQGFNIVRIDTADKIGAADTVILDHRGKAATVAKLAAEMKLPASAIKIDPDLTATADVTVILGADYRAPR